MSKPKEFLIFELVGWWDCFNCVLYEAEKDALLAMQGGNEVFKVYRLIVENK